MAEEEILHGGHMNHVVRVGDSVRRRATPATRTIHRLLTHVRANGAAWAPEPRGYDELGREVLAFVPGEVPHAMPPWIWEERVLTDVALALRQWHDATATFDRTGAVWGLETHEPVEVVCHNDFAPYNCVFDAGRFVAAIDFDLCSPGPRVWDLAYTAYRFVPLMPPRSATVDDGAQERSPFALGEMLQRLDALLDTYAGGNATFRHERTAVLRVVSERLQTIAEFTTEHVALTGDPALANHARMYRAHAGWLAALMAT